VTGPELFIIPWGGRRPALTCISWLRSEPYLRRAAAAPAHPVARPRHRPHLRDHLPGPGSGPTRWPSATLRFGQGNGAAPAGRGWWPWPRHAPGRGRERQPPWVAPEVLVAAGLGLIWPVIWTSQEAVW